MPGNRLSPRWILQMRFCRSSSLTVRLPSLASEKELLRSRPRVRGNSKVDLDTHPPSVRDCTRRFTAEAQRRGEDEGEKIWMIPLFSPRLCVSAVKKIL